MRMVMSTEVRHCLEPEGSGPPSLETGDGGLLMGENYPASLKCEREVVVVVQRRLRKLVGETTS
jgi:hypothetical protein